MYSDISLTLIQKPMNDDDDDLIVMEVTCRYMKGGRNRKTDVMHERDDNPVFYICLHLHSQIILLSCRNLLQQIF
jgi:hypothetical protein